MKLRPKTVPHAATSRSNQKAVRIPDANSPDRPAWRFSTVDLGGPFAWPKGIETELHILEKLHNFDSMSWDEIQGNDHHAIPIDRLSKEAAKRLTDINQDDIAEIFSFHFSGKTRIIGIRDRNIVKLLWWDPEHQVCPSHKKHT